MFKNYSYPYFVEYIDEFGNEQCETWSERTLNEELNKGEVKITYISLAWDVQVALGLQTED